MRAKRTIKTVLLALPLAGAFAAAPALAGSEAAPRFLTGRVRASGTTAELEGRVIPHELPTSYAFEYGPTTALGTKTKITPITPPSGNSAKIDVTQTVTGFASGYWYRIVGFWTSSKGPQEALGKLTQYVDQKTVSLHFDLGKGTEANLKAVYGGSVELSGSLQGSGAGDRELTLQQTPFPFTSPFTSLPGTVVTSTGGLFTFKLGRLTQSTEFRFVTSGTKPVTSRPVLVRVTPKITLHVRRGGKTALFRFYGTVQPARNGATIQIQQLLPQKATSKKEGPRAHTVASTTLRRNSSSSSRFSVVVKLDGNYRYRAFVRLPKGPLASGPGSNVLVKAPKAQTDTEKHS